MTVITSHYGLELENEKKLDNNSEIGVLENLVGIKCIPFSVDDTMTLKY